jgi:hypothetical protein
VLLEFLGAPAPREETALIMLWLELYLADAGYLGFVKFHAN